MKIKTLTIKDFRSHQDTVIELHPRLNVFIGPNGSGKSSIRDAISVILCGRTPELAFEGPSGKTNMQRIIREGAPSFHLEMESDLGKHIAHCSDGRLSIENQPDILRDRALWALDPGLFFDAPQARRDQIIAEMSGVNFKDASGMLEAQAKKLGVSDHYSDWYIADLTDLQRKIKRFEEDRRKAKKELDGLTQFREMALPEGVGPENLVEYKNLHREVTDYRARYSTLADTIPSLKKSLEVVGATGDPAAIKKDLDEANAGLIRLRMKLDYVNAGKCPLEFDCDKLDDKEAMKAHRDRIIQEGQSLKKKAAELEALHKEVSDRNAMSKRLAAAELEFKALEDRREEMEKKNHRYTELVELDAFAKLDVVKRKAELANAEKHFEALDKLLEYIHKDLLPKAMGATRKFQEIIQQLSPYPVTYDGGEFKLAGRPYGLLSTSQKYRCQVALAEALAGNLGVVVFDEFNLLDHTGANAELKPAMANDDRQTIALIGYTRKLPPDPPLKPLKPDAGKIFWVDRQDGISRISVIQ